MDRVDIVLAAFNGEKYISQQLDSIISQSYKNWRLLISDDGSTDKTLSIIEEYTETDERIILVNKNRQGGVVKNFSKALEFVNSPYIMFADQDDYWLPQKIEHLKAIIEKKEKEVGNIPLLVFSDLIVVDENLKILNPSFFANTGLDPTYNFDARFLLWRSTVYGCTVMFNKSLYEISTPLPHEVTMHDQWFALIACLNGEVIYSSVSHVYYRQHDNNVVGAKNRKLIARVKRFFISTKKIKNAAHLTNKTVAHLNGDQEKTLSKRIEFVFKNIIPFYRIGKIYTAFFIYYYIRNYKN